ncbi:hypothetical protein [Clostridium disporicum]|uniref:Uncharacterized protein n=1 Tax=Clostridium disporicum TaxID=84024 RepID=A0A173YB07_9CLOT|nr:hypothetical protein [Clostridium disporicum]MDU6339693.1 hypothetical protein [Clostridium sp.]CUN60195.1 Uncharacterised protein [Clostridium disporicum]
MKFKNLVWTLSKDDILSICKLLDKVTINKVEITDNIIIGGSYRVVGLNVDFEAKLALLPVNNNIVYIKVVDFKLAKKDITNPLVKKSMNLIINSITSIDGITYDSNTFKIELEKILNSICDESQKVHINDLYIESVKLINKEITLNLNLANITISNLK